PGSERLMPTPRRFPRVNAERPPASLVLAIFLLFMVLDVGVIGVEIPFGPRQDGPVAAGVRIALWLVAPASLAFSLYVPRIVAWVALAFAAIILVTGLLGLARALPGPTSLQGPFWLGHL